MRTKEEIVEKIGYAKNLLESPELTGLDMSAGCQYTRGALAILNWVLGTSDDFDVHTAEIENEINMIRESEEE